MSKVEQIREEIPYGLRIASDCRHLEENPAEVSALTVMMEGIVADRRLSAIAEDLNRRGFRGRDGDLWTQVSVFHMLPRLIEFGPRIYGRDEWRERRKQLKVVSG